MTHQIDFRKLFENNPNADPDKVAEAIRLLKELRKQGVEPDGYKLVPPHSRNQVKKGGSDPRALYLPK